jgi:porin
MTLRYPILAAGLAFGLPAVSAEPAAVPAVESAKSPSYGGPIMERSTLLGSLWGLRDTWAEHGFTFERNVVYTFQGISSGGRTQAGHDTAHLLSGNLVARLDTEKADLWKGGFWNVRLEGREGQSVNRRAGTISPVNADALLPLNEGELGDNAWALSEVSFTQFVHPEFALTAGLLNTASGDANPIAGSLQSNSHFLNTGIVMSPVIIGQLPQTALGGGFLWKPSDEFRATVLAMGTKETAGSNPFEEYEGTTFLAELDWEYELFGERPGGMGLSATYSIGQERRAVTGDPRIVLTEFLEEGEALTEADAWAVFWNGFQFVNGTAERGWGVFGRLGFSDASPSPVSFHLAAGLGGTGLLPGRSRDRWGLGVYHQELSDKGLLGRLPLGSETGGEAFYSIAFTPWMRLTLDAQYVDSALPRVGHAVALGTRLGIDF